MPWIRFLAEGKPSITHFIDTEYKKMRAELDSRIYFPLKANEEQKQIVYRLNQSPCVVVKGPPGIGKSQTIANLICHLLACGERILVTAQAPKALTVLRGKLPLDLQNLCGTALGASREDQKLLKKGISEILRRQEEWQGSKKAQEQINQLEKQLQTLEEELSKVNRRIMELREAETYTHQLQGGYEGTAAKIAQRIEQEQEFFDWFPDILRNQPSFPLTDEEVHILANMHTRLTPKFEEELNLDLGNFDLPDPNTFVDLIEQLKKAETEAQQYTTITTPEKREQLRNIETDVLPQLVESILQLEQFFIRAERVIGSLAKNVLEDLLSGLNDRWSILGEEINQLDRKFDALTKTIGYSKVTLPEEINHIQLLTDAIRRLQYFENGGQKNFFFFKPKVVRETQYVEKLCAVDGVAPYDVASFRKLVAYLQLVQCIDDFKSLWPGSFTCPTQNPIQQAKLAKELFTEFKQFLLDFEKIKSSNFRCIPITARIDLAQQQGRNSWLNAIKAEIAARKREKICNMLGKYFRLIKEIPNVHPCLFQLAEALKKRNPKLWQQGWKEREIAYTNKKQLNRYKEILEKLIVEAPLLVAKLWETQGDPTWKPKLLELKKAWFWASARGWLKQLHDQDCYESLVLKIHRLRGHIEETVKEIAVLRAWKCFFERLDEVTIQNLKAWKQAIRRIWKDTGKYAYRRRKVARQYLMRYIPKIPAWIMPLHKLYETTEAKPGLFDTIIIDEVSQAGTDALVLFLLAKRIIIVGDDKQNSPEAVAIREDDITRLIRRYLVNFHFRDEFRPDASPFDHAERTFGQLITLREHFRCVPEIIRFSNELWYRDTPLISLRQPPPERLPPLRSTYVPGGFCEGQRDRLINRVEAEKLVEQIVKCINDKAYEGKTMGVIVLQGYAQAQLIEKLQLEKLDPRIVQERKLWCGGSSTFQRDERDVIFLSMVVAPNIQYRALTTVPYERRFNVAVSRAKDQVWLFHSAQLSELSPQDLRFKLLNFIQNPIQENVVKVEEERKRLEYAVQRAPKPRPHNTQPDPYDSWFEVDVALELLRKKYQIRPQHEVAGKRIDIVVEGTDNPLAVESDGDIWHGPEHSEENMARQHQLERTGWIFVRIRAFGFYANRGKTIEKIISACRELGIQPVDYNRTEPSKISLKDEKQTFARQKSEFNDKPKSTITRKNKHLPDLKHWWFSKFSSTDFPDPRYASPLSIREALYRIIKEYGPLTRASIYRLYIEGCPSLQKVGKTIRQLLNRALGFMLRAGEIVQEDELEEETPESLVVRITGTPQARERPAGGRDLLEIPPSELMVVLKRIENSLPRNIVDNDTIYRQLLEYYGFTRLTGNRRVYLAKVLRLYRAK